MYADVSEHYIVCVSIQIRYRAVTQCTPKRHQASHSNALASHLVFAAQTLLSVPHKTKS